MSEWSPNNVEGDLPSTYKRIQNGLFNDSDGSIYVITPDCCTSLDDDCSVEMMSKNKSGYSGQTQRIACATKIRSDGRCPFVAD